MYKYRSKNGDAKLNSALKDTNTDLSIGSSCAFTGIEETCWSPSI